MKIKRFLALFLLVALSLAACVRGVEQLGTSHYTSDINDFSGTIQVDTISEHTSANGVAVDGVVLKDSGVQLGSGGLYALGAAASGSELFCSTATFTGTSVITAATHGITTPAAVVATLTSAPGVDAGNPFMAHVIYSGSTITLTVVQDDTTAAATAATVDYCVFGAD